MTSTPRPRMPLRPGAPPALLSGATAVAGGAVGATPATPEGPGGGISGAAAHRHFPLFKLVRVLSVAHQPAPPAVGQATAGAAGGAAATADWVAVRPDDVPLASIDVGIRLAAAGGCVGHAFLAVVTAHDQLIVRYMGQSGFPLVRAIPWYRDAARRIVALAFNPSAEWLLLVGADGAVYLLPVFALVVQQDQQAAAAALASLAAAGADAGVQLAAAAAVRPGRSGARGEPGGSATPTDPAPAPSSAPAGTTGAAGTTDWLGRLPMLMSYALDPSGALASGGSGTPSTVAHGGGEAEGELGSVDDITVVCAAGRLAMRAHSGAAPGAVCAWWRTWSGVDCAIVGTAGGQLAVIDLWQRAEVYSTRLKAAITQLDIVDDVVQSFRYLLIQAEDGYHKLVLEQQTDEYNMADTLLAAPGRAPFAVVPVQRFQRDRTLR